MYPLDEDTQTLRSDLMDIESGNFHVYAGTDEGDTVWCVAKGYSAVVACDQGGRQTTCGPMEWVLKVQPR